MATEGSEWRIDWRLIVRALDMIRNPTARDADGICVLIIRIFVYGHSEVAEALFSNLFNSRSFMESFWISGKVYGKDSKFPAVDKTRAVLPLPAVLVVADAFIACKIHDLANRICIESVSLLPE